METDRNAESADAYDVITNSDQIANIVKRTDLDRFADILIASCLDPAIDVGEETLKRLQREVGYIPESEGPIPPDSPIRKTNEWDRIRRFVVGRYVEMAISGDLAVALVDGKVAGISGIKLNGTFNKRKVYELSHVVVLPEFAGRNLAKTMIDANLKRIREHDEGAFVLAYTRHPAIKKTMEDLQAARLSETDHVDINASNELWKPSLLARRIQKSKKGWQAFLSSLPPESPAK